MQIKKCFFLSLLISFVISAKGASSNQPSIQFFKLYDKHGINIFETSKLDTVVFTGLNVRLGANVTQQFQMLKHKNTANSKLDVDGKTNLNRLTEIGPGFNLATANFNMDVQLADGIRLCLTSYLSSRHHPETWVKGGYIQIDKLPIKKSSLLYASIFNQLMNNITIKVGHFEINYGDSHFRRTDNGHAAFNPFVGNYILNAFTTEIGSELYLQSKGIIAMIALTGGEIQGNVINPKNRSNAIYGKFGYDKQVTNDWRVRITSSVYNTPMSINNTLYFGDRAGSRYYMVIENQKATTSENFYSGTINPMLNKKVLSFTLNPFLKYKGLEFFGNYERAAGSTLNESGTRQWQQMAADFIYRFTKNEHMYVGLRYNIVKGELPGVEKNIVVSRIQGALGCWITDNILFKGEYVTQVYKNFTSDDIRNGGTFNGFIFEGVVTF